MEQAGLRTWQDAAGNQCGRREGRDARAAGAAARLAPRHRARTPGRTTGCSAWCMAIAVAERLRDRDLPFALEVIGFSDEEGTRFGKALLGSAAVAGHWDEEWWDLRDRDGVTLHQAFHDVRARPAPGRRGRPRARASWSATSRRTSSRARTSRPRTARSATSPRSPARAGSALSVVGEARHAGGTPYPRRRDALVGASEAIIDDRADGARVRRRRVHRHRRPDRGAARARST